MQLICTSPFGEGSARHFTQVQKGSKLGLETRVACLGYIAHQGKRSCWNPGLGPEVKIPSCFPRLHPPSARNKELVGRKARISISSHCQAGFLLDDALEGGGGNDLTTSEINPAAES